MTITDDRSTTPTPPAAPPSYVRRHPIIAAFGVLSGLSLFSALWPFSAIVVGVVVAGHATGLDRAALHLAERLAIRVRSSLHDHVHPEPEPAAPVAPQPPAPASPAPRREVHAPAAPSPPAPQSRRAPHPHAPTTHHHEPARRPKCVDREVGARRDGPGL